MKLVGRDETALELSVDGYQFPDIADDCWDSNWLMVSGRVRHPHGSWTFTDPCLTTFELEQLASWLDDVAAGRPNPDLGYFTEPNLCFCYRQDPEPTIEVRIAYESAPPWLVGEPRMGGAALEFPLVMNDPRVAAAEIRSFISRFPVRGPAD